MNTADIFQTPSELKLDQLSFCKSSIRSIQEWISQLNLQRLGDTSRSLFNAILEISQLKCSETLRYDLIQTIYPIVNNVLQSLEKYFFNQSLIIDDRNQQIIELSLLVRTHFAKVYIDIARRTHQELEKTHFALFSFKSKKNIQTARTLSTYFALQQLALLFYQQQTLYSSALLGQWIAAHQLFFIAKQNGFHLNNINQILGIQESIQDIEQAYSQIIILYILNTYQILPIEMQDIFLCSHDWVKYVQISNHENALSRYVIDTESDLPPLIDNHQETNHSTHLFVSTHALLDYLNDHQGHKHNQFANEEKVFLSPSLYFHVYTVLTTQAKRRHERYEYSTRIKICFGLLASHFYLSKAKNFKETLELSPNDINSPENLFIKDINRLNQEKFQFSESKLDRETKKIHQIDVMDISVNGYRVRWTGKTPKNLKAGEFILVQENRNSPWRGGVIRWIKQSSEKSIDLGLEILSEQILPCAFYLQIDQNIGHYHPALIIQTSQLDEVNISIILPGIPILKEKQSIRLRLDKKEIKVFLLKPILITQSFMQFSFELVNEQERLYFDQHISNRLNEIKYHDLWETLK